MIAPISSRLHMAYVIFFLDNPAARQGFDESHVFVYVIQEAADDAHTDGIIKQP